MEEYIRSESNRQDTLHHTSPPEGLHCEGRGSAAAVTVHAYGGEPDESDLPCRYRNNENKESETSITPPADSTNLLASTHRKTAHALVENVAAFIRCFGIEFVGFLTLTFADNVIDHKEAYKRFSSFRVGFLRRHPYFGEWICVKERQKRGAWHYHLLIYCAADILTGFNFDEVRAGVYTSASQHLRSLWADLREKCPKYNFGRFNLEPIKGNAEAISRYLGKYISKHIENRRPEDKGVRLVSYSSSWARSGSRFQWYTDNSKLWRLQVGHFALCCGFTRMEEFSECFGHGWAYYNAESIVNGDWIERARELTPEEIEARKEYMRTLLESRRPSARELVRAASGFDELQVSEEDRRLIKSHAECPDDAPPF